MPELPEVEYTARQLRAAVAGAMITGALVFWERTIGHPDLPAFLAGIADRRITGVRRRGKYLVIDLAGNLILTIHRRMTGNLLLLAPGWTLDTSLRETDPAAWNVRGPIFRGSIWCPQRTNDAEDSNKESASYTSRLYSYCRACFILAGGRCLLFTDPRKFGRIELWPREHESEALAGLGPEPLSSEFTVEGLMQGLAQRRGPIKQALLDQAVIAGLGNIYADEALYYAAIHPLRPANSLTPEEARKLHEGIIAVLTLGIEYGGTSFGEYRDLQGEAGNNYDHLRVYHKSGAVKHCERCGTPIEHIVIAQRMAHFCPRCQKLSAG